MKKRILCFILAFTMLLSLLPVSALAAESRRLYGDVNGNGNIDLLDMLILKLYIAEENPTGFVFENADVNCDNTADMIDLLMLKKYLAEWDIKLGPELSSIYFYDGDRLIDVLFAEKNSPLTDTPASGRISKAGAVFEGWYTDAEFTTPFYFDDPVQGDMNVYAKYDVLDDSALTITSFAQLDLSKDATFTVVGSGNPNDITLAAKDGSDQLLLEITGTNPYTVSALGGFKEGGSYEIMLPEGLNFVNSEGETMPDSVRTASFTIKKAVVDNLSMSDDVRYVRYADTDSLAVGATVTLADAKVGDLICFYKTTNPKDRDYTTGEAYMDDPETWFKVGEVNGETVTLAEMDENDTAGMYDVPDNFPVMGSLPTGDGTLTLAADQDGYRLDVDFYQQMMEEGVTASLELANEKVSVGDFLSIYTSSEDVSNGAEVYYGKITAYNAETGTITYVKSSVEEIEHCMDLYVKPVLEGDDLLTEEAKAQIEATVLAQLKESSFAEEAGMMLADMATETDGFRKMESAQVLYTDENGNPLTDEQIQLLNLGKSFELKDGVTLTAEIITAGDQLHFHDKGSVQLAVGIDAQFEVELEDDEKIVIDLSATFAQELALGATANGELVKKKILGIPIPIGVKLGSSVDLYSYTGVRLDVHAYTVAPEDQSVWEQLQAVAKDPRSLVDLLPEGDKFAKVADGLNTVGDVFDKIEEVKSKIEELRNDAEQLKGYVEDMELLWEMVEEMDGDLPDAEEWEAMGKTLGQTNVSKELMDMLDLSTDTELDSERYAEGLDGLLEKYAEMLETETDWVTLVNKEICSVEINICGFVIYAKADFVVRADMNIAMGTSLQYEVGKRYTFWIKIGLFKPEAGSSTMDLVDEQFAFQFYVMGKIGLKMGVEATAGFALGSAKVARVGIHVELGPYTKIYGFFIYEYQRLREAGSSKWVSSQQMAGALYVEFGLYLIMGVDAAALNDKISISYDFFDKEFPLLEAGTKYYPYAFAYEPMDDELVVITDEDANSTNGITMKLPDEYRALKYCDLTNGYMGERVYDLNKYNFTFSNPAFSMNKDGVISVDVPEGARYIECNMTITYKGGKLAFSTYDMQVTIPLVWTNMSLDEINQYYTASVRVGDAESGYTTVWSRRVRKNQELTLPTLDELKALIGYDEAKYTAINFPKAGETVTLVENAAYEATVAYKEYSITVNGVAGNAPTTYTTHYGEVFDFTALNNTGVNDPLNGQFTKFQSVTTDAQVQVGTDANGSPINQTIDLTQPISGKVAQAIAKGDVTATANYVDDSVQVTYTFTGIDVKDHVERIRKGTESTYDFSAVAAEAGMAVKSITPALGKVDNTTTYTVECGKIVGPEYTLTFVTNGGTDVAPITRVGGALVGNITPTTRTGYSFEGWYTDSALTNKFDSKLMPKENTTLYAKWKAIEVTATLNVYGGEELTDGNTITVTYGSTYGSLPTPTRIGYGFIGWFTEQSGGVQVSADTLVTTASDHTLYAHWKVLHEIPAAVFDFGEAEGGTYAKGQTHEVLYDFAAEEGETYQLSDFTFKYMRQGDTEYAEGLPVNAGTYNVTVSRPADNDYAKFEQTYTAVITIDKATRTLGAVNIRTFDPGMTWMNLQLDGNGGIDDLSSEATFTYQVVKKSGSGPDGHTGASADRDSLVTGLFPATEYYVTVKVTDDPNYTDAESTLDGASVVSTASAPTGNWADHADTSWYDSSRSEFTLTLASELAGLAKLVNSGTIFSGKTVKLGADIDLLAYQWTPIGNSSYSFRGTFDGQNHTVKGMYADCQYSGLFGNIYSTTVKNLTLEDSYVTGSDYAGGIVGYAKTNDNRSVISNCVVEKTVTVYGTSTGDNYTGGIAGSCYNEYSVTGCTNRGTVYGGSYVGGIVGHSNDAIIITNCVNYGPIRGTGSYIGGITGYTYDECNVLNSANFGSVTGNDCVGGIVGKTERKSSGKKYPNNVLNCYNVGTVYGKTYVGAIVGGRHTTDDAVHQCYYLPGSATNQYGAVKAVGISGTGSADSENNLQIATFTSYSGSLSGNGGCGNDNLITALNNWVEWWNDKQCSAKWEEGPDGYPLPTGEINTASGTKN